MAETEEAAGADARAASYCARVAELWADADPELQPRVAEATRRIQMLARIGTGLMSAARVLSRLIATLVATGVVSACASAPERSATRQTLLLDPSHPEWSRPAPPVSRMRFETSKGAFVLELIREGAPIGADRFYNLVRLGFYDGARFHRVSPGYIVQFGLHGDPAVTAGWRDHELADDPPRADNRRGTFAFAMKGPNTRLTQIYINLDDNSRNDGEPFTMLGTVIEGMDVLDSLYSGYRESSGSGMRQGRQGPIEEGGNAYLDREFPLLDRLIRACVIAPVQSCAPQ